MKILFLGSGPDRIGKTGELDRFALQGLRFIKSEGHELIWVDNNPITLTSVSREVHRVYLEPLTLKMLERIIEQEKPWAIMPTFGGNIAMHLVIFLDREGILDRYNVRVLGTSVSGLKRYRDAGIFRKTLRDLGLPLMEALIVHSMEECYHVSRSLGFPIILRPGFALEGIGGYLAYNVDELREFARMAFNLSPVQEVVVERAPADWIQFAVELIHDPVSSGKVYPVGTFEALDWGVGVHPGNSVVVTPAPTLKGDLLEKALSVAGHIAGTMEICGSFQVRFALSPVDDELVVLRVVYGLNRFSSLFSALRSIPLAEINAGLSLGLSFEQLKQKLDMNGFTVPDNTVTAVRVPIFPDEFSDTQTPDSTMRCTGAAVFVGSNLPVALNKSLDYLYLSEGVEPIGYKKGPFKAVGEVSRNGQEVVYKGANSAFLPALKNADNLFRMLKNVAGEPFPPDLVRKAKAMGISNEGIARRTSKEITTVNEACHQEGIYPSLVSIVNGRRFVSYDPDTGDRKADGKVNQESASTILILGPGPYRIGWGPEVDIALVQTAGTLKGKGNRIILINNNPDAVSQDSKFLDHICLEAPILEVIESLIQKYSVDGLIHQFCFSLPEGLDHLLEKHGVRVLGTPLPSRADLQDVVYLRKKMMEIGIPMFPHALVADTTLASEEAAHLGYPVLVRLTGDDVLNPNTEIIYHEAGLMNFLGAYRERISEQTPLLIESYQEGLVGIKVLAIGDGEKAASVAFLENIEEYGVHSGDCAVTIPTISIGDFVKASIEEVIQRLVKAFNVTGHLLIDLALKGRNFYVVGLWPFPSSTLSLVHRATGRTIHEDVVRLLLGGKIADLQVTPFKKPDRYCVKESVFPFSQLPRLNPVLSPRMQSTGQVLGVDQTFSKAYFKSQIAVNPKMLLKGGVFVSARDSEKEAILQVSQKLSELGFSLVSAEGTAQFLEKNGLTIRVIQKVSEWRPNVIDLIKNGEISLVINIPGGFQSKQDEQAIHRATIEHNIPLITTASGALLFVQGIGEIRKTLIVPIPFESWR